MSNWRIEITKPNQKPTYGPIPGRLSKDEAEKAFSRYQAQHATQVSKVGATLRLVSPEEWDKINGWTGPTCPDCGRPMVTEGKTSYCEYCEG